MSNVNCSFNDITNLNNQNRLAYYKFRFNFYDNDILTTMVKQLFLSKQKLLKNTNICDYIKIQKNKIYNFVLNRKFDSYSNIIIKYNDIKKVNIVELPQEINNIINEFLKLDVKFNMSTNGSAIFNSYKYKSKNIVIQKLNLKMNRESVDKNIFDYVNNTLPSVAIPFNELNLEIESNYDVKIKIIFDSIIYESELRRNISCNKYEYNNKLETIIMSGMIVNRKCFN